VFGVLAFVLDGVFAGAAMGKDMRNGMMLSALAFFAIWAIAVPLWGIYGLWLALHGFFIARSVIFLWLLMRRVPSLFEEDHPEQAAA
jgi:MATE family multidrug resistance protein